MGLFDFWKKKTEKAEPELVAKESKVLLAMPIFVNNKSYSLDQVINHLKTFWGVDASKIIGDNETATFYVDGIMVILANMPLPIPQKELDDVVPYTYMWRTASADLKGQTGHAIVSVTGDKASQIKRYTILSKLICSIMATCNDCVGVYQGNETLLLQKDFYLAAVDDIKNDRIPVPAWIYIGLRPSQDGFDAYTYGLSNFDKPEIEIIGSKLELDNLYKLILSISSYFIGYDIQFKKGDTYSLSDGINLKLELSQGIYTDENTLKVEV